MKPRRLLPPPDPSSLRAAALRYVARYAASSARLRRVLEARLSRAAREHPAWAADGARQAALRQTIAQLVAEFTERRYIDDAAFAASKARGLRQQGKSQRLIAAKLQAEGLSADEIGAALQSDDADPAAQELAAAQRLAQRKRLGPYRRGPADAATTQRDYAAFARAGFSSAIARQVLQTPLDEDDIG